MSMDEETSAILAAERAASVMNDNGVDAFLSDVMASLYRKRAAIERKIAAAYKAWGRVAPQVAAEYRQRTGSGTKAAS